MIPSKKDFRLLNRNTLLRVSAWIGIALFLSWLAAPNFLTLLSQTLSYTFGSIFPAVPFAALLSVLFLLRGNDLLQILANEKGLRTEKSIRLVGSAIIVPLLLFREITSESIYFSAVAIILVFYASSLIVNPLTKQFMFSYAIIYVVGVSAPAIIQWGVGGSLAGFSAALSARLVALSGIPVVWHGTQFGLTSKTGEYLNATVTPGCSSVISITTFLGLLALMHLDLKKNLSSTLKLGIIGTIVLTILNAVRIMILIWVGYSSGTVEFWSLHNWVGYALFLGFYLAVIPAYGGTTKHVQSGIFSSQRKSGIFRIAKVEFR